MKILQYNLYRARAGQSLVGCLLILVIWLLVVWAMCSWTDRSLDFWLSYAKGEAVDCPFWLSTLVTFAAPIALFLNLVSEVARLAI